MKIRFDYKDEVISLPARFLSYTDKSSELALKLLLSLAGDIESRNDFSQKDYAKRFAVKESEIKKALEFWERAGIIVTDFSKSKTKKVSTEHIADNGSKVTLIQNEGGISYTGEEIKRIFEDREEISSTIDECSKIAGKVFSVNEVNKLIGLLDYLNLEPEYVILLFSYCKSIEKATVHYLERTAYELYNEGIVTYKTLEEYISEKEKHNDFEAIVRKLCGIGTRAFSAKEKKFISLWCDFETDLEILSLAYEVTVNNTGSASMPYMNKVLSNWREAGYKTKEDVEKATEEYKNKKKKQGGSFDTDEFLEAAIERSFESVQSKRNT